MQKMQKPNRNNCAKFRGECGKMADRNALWYTTIYTEIMLHIQECN